MVEEFVDTQNARNVQKRFTDPKACQEWGGHCWEEGPYRPAIIFPSLNQQMRVCKHCGLKQRGVYQEPVRWEEIRA